MEFQHLFRTKICPISEAISREKEIFVEKKFSTKKSIHSQDNFAPLEKSREMTKKIAPSKFRRFRPSSNIRTSVIRNDFSGPCASGRLGSRVLENSSISQLSNFRQRLLKIAAEERTHHG